MKWIILLLCLPFVAFSQYEIGDQAEDFTMMSTDFKQVSLSDYSDANGFIIIFTCNHCPYAKAYEDRIIALHEDYADKGYPVIAINPNDPAVQPDDSFEKMVERAKDKGFEFAYLFDKGQKVYPKFGATRTPHVFLLDQDRIVRYIGSIDNNYKSEAQADEKYLRDAIEALIKGDEPDPSFTKAIGCSIKKA